MRFTRSRPGRQRQKGGEGADRSVLQLRCKVAGQVSQNLTGELARAGDRCHQLRSDVGEMLLERSRIGVLLDDDGLRPVRVEVDVVAEGPGVLLPYDLHALS